MTKLEKKLASAEHEKNMKVVYAIVNYSDYIAYNR